MGHDTPAVGRRGVRLPSKGTVRAPTCCSVRARHRTPRGLPRVALRPSPSTSSPSPDGAPSPIPGAPRRTAVPRSAVAHPAVDPLARPFNHHPRRPVDRRPSHVGHRRAAETLARRRGRSRRRRRARENNKIGSPDKERARGRAARAAEAAAAAEFPRARRRPNLLGIRASTEGADALSRSDDFDLTSYYVPRDPPPPPLETATRRQCRRCRRPRARRPRRRRRRSRRRSSGSVRVRDWCDAPGRVESR